MRENCTYGSMRGRAFPTGRPALLYTLLSTLYTTLYSLYNGKAQIVVRAAENPGKLTVRGRLASTGATVEIVLTVH